MNKNQSKNKYTMAKIKEITHKNLIITAPQTLSD